MTEPTLITPKPGPVPLFPSFSPNPTVQELTAARIFEEPLVPVWGNPTAAENQALANALLAFAGRQKADDFSALTAFLNAPVSYCWYPAVAYCLGWEYYHTGYYSKAIQMWEDAWWWVKDAPGSEGKGLADRTIGELARMHSRIGDFERLDELLAEVKNRPLDGPATERIAAAKQALWLMRNHPETAFRCGPLALQSIRKHRDKQRGIDELILESTSTRQGFSLEQVHILSRELKMGLQIARRQRGAKVPLPCLVHWNVGHYAALVKREGDRFLVTDPTFGKSLWISRDALEAESSGYFLVAEGNLPPGWQSVGDQEARNVWGKGVTTGSNPNDTTPTDMKARLPCSSVGMVVPNSHLMVVSLNLEDTPLSFQPPRGPRIELTLTYNQREANQPATFSYSNFGNKWTCNWISYIKDNGTNTPADVEHYVGGGGTEIYTGFDTNTQAFSPQWRTQSILKRVSASSYELTYADGSRLVFTNIDGTVGNTRKVFLTQMIDPTGYTNRVEYDSQMRITTVKDVAAGVDQLTFAYNDALMNGSANSIKTVTDPYGRKAVFDYGNSFGYELHAIKDVIQLASSFTYSGDFINSLTTPYGTTTFAYGEDGRTRWLETTNPEGGVSRVEYTERTDIGIPTSDPGPVVPKGMFTRNYILFGRNTFYWDEKAMRESPGDYSKARLYHWLHSEDLASAIGVLESYKEPLENRVWFNYPGQVSDFSATYLGPGVTNAIALPSMVGRVLDDGTTQLWQYQRNFLGQITNALDPVGREFSYVYATNGIDLLEVRQTRSTNDELLASFTWNAQHLPLTFTNAARQTGTFAYNSHGQVTYITNALSEVTAFSYDSAGRLLSIDGPLAGTGDTVSFTYDAYDRVFTATDVDGYVVTNYYDKLDRITTNAFPDGTTEITTYTNLSAATFTDRENRVTSWVHDSLQRLREIHEATNWVTRLEWCRCGDLESVTDPMGRMTHWLYDIQGRVTAKVYPDKSLEQYAYESTTSRLKAFTNERGQKRAYLYEYDDTLLQVQFADTNVTPTVTYYYDTNYHRLTAMVDGTGTTVFTYYPFTTNVTLGAGRLQTRDGPFSNDTLEFTYDELGRVKSEKMYDSEFAGLNTPPYFDGYAYQYLLTYDALGRVTQTQNTLDTTYPFSLQSFPRTYDGASSRLASIGYSSFVSATYTYTNAARDFGLKEINLTDWPNVWKFTYDLNHLGTITNWIQQINGGTASEYRLQHNALAELTGVTVVAGGATNQTYNYAYDLAGNRTQEKIDSATVNAWHNPLNQLIGKDAGTTATNRTYEWDEENRLHAIVEGSNRTEFFYNGFGQVGRILEKTGSTTNQNRYLTWSGGRLVKERNVDGSNTYLKWYYPEGYFDLYELHNGAAHYFLRDHLGSVRYVVRDWDGAVQRSYDYDPYGRATKSSDAFSSTPPHAGPNLGFTGLFTLEQQHLVMAKHRVYDPDLGRWLSRDPIGEAGGLNLYRYANNDPINWIDLDGLCAQKGTILRDGQFRDPNTGKTHNADGSVARDQLNPFNSGNQAGPSRAGPLRAGAAKAIPNPGGRLGNPLTRQTAANVISDLKARGFTDISQEVFFQKGPLGLKNRFADVVGANPVTGESLIINIGRQTQSGIPIMRERMALDDIIFSPTIQNYPNSRLLFIKTGANGLPPSL